MHFGQPFALLLLLLVPLVCVRRDGMAAVRVSPRHMRNRSPVSVLAATPVSLASLVAFGRSRERAVVLNALRALALVALIIALARPQSFAPIAPAEESGRDIAIVLDVSGSMRALDFQINDQRVDRLVALKHVMTGFIDGQRGDRMALIVFGSEVYTQCPLTTDLGVLQEFLAGLEVGMVGDGTAIGDAIAIAVKRLRAIKANSRVIVLVTDGLKTAGSLEPEAAAELAQKEGIKVYTIGIGGDKPAPFPVTGMFGEPRLTYLPVELDEKTLKAIADKTGGKYFRAQQTDKLTEISEEISKLEQRIETAQNSVEYEDRFLPFLCFGIVLFFLHELLFRTRYQLFPENVL